MLPQEVLDEQIVAELAFMDLHSAITDDNIINRVLSANEEFINQEGARERLDQKGTKWHIEEGRLLFEGRLR